VDSGLLAKAVGKLARTVRRVHWAGGATRTHVRDRRRAASRRVREIASKLRTRGKLAREESTAAIRRVTGELVRLAETAAAEAAAVLRNGRRGLRHIDNGRLRGRLRRALDELATTIERAGRIANQTRARLAWQAPEGVTRLVSLHDPDAGRSARAASTGRSSSATRRRSSTTTTASSWTTPSNPAAHRPSPPGGDRRPRLRRGGVENEYTPSASVMWRSRARPRRQPRDEKSNTDEASADWSNGAPDRGGRISYLKRS
jgi:hypothetical protein